MEDEDFMKELQELTKNMSQEFSGTMSSASGKDTTKTGKCENPFDMNFGTNEADYLKAIESMLGSDMNFKVDESDPQAKEMMKLLTDNLKDLELKMNEMQKNIVNENEQNPNPNTNTNINSSFNIMNTFSALNSLNNPLTPTNPDKENSSTPENKTVPKAEKPVQETPSSKNTNSSNPFVDTFREMKENQMGNGMNDLLKLLEGGNGMPGLGDIPEGETGDIKNLYDILGKLSDNKDINGGEPDKAKLEGLFGDLLEFLLKSDMLAEPLSQIKNSVTSYLEKNKDKLKPEEEEKYKSMLVSIDTIMSEIQKKEPNKALVIDIFYKLHELSDIDSEILPSGDSSFKQFSDLFTNKN